MDQCSTNTVPFLAIQPACSSADSKKPLPRMVKSMQGRANWMIMSLKVSKLLGRCKSSTRKLILQLFSAKFFMACFRESVFLLVIGESILGRNMLPASKPSLSSLIAAAGSMWINSSAVILLWVTTVVYIYVLSNWGMYKFLFKKNFLLSLVKEIIHLHDKVDIVFPYATKKPPSIAQSW